MNIIENRRIELTECNYKADFNDFDSTTLKYCMERSSFFIHKGLCFQDRISKKELIRNQLLYYPKLVLAIRQLNIKNYPYLIREYPIDDTLKGRDFMNHLCHSYNEAYEDFTNMLQNSANQIDSLINKFGEERYMPLIEEVNKGTKTTILIHGIEWELYDEYKKQEERYLISFAILLDIPKYLDSSSNRLILEVEEFIKGTSFIALRIRYKYKNKGHVV